MSNLLPYFEKYDWKEGLNCFLAHSTTDKILTSLNFNSQSRFVKDLIAKADENSFYYECFSNLRCIPFAMISECINLKAASHDESFYPLLVANQIEFIDKYNFARFI